MENRIYNFNPGPAMQPLEVLQEAQKEFLNFAGSGMSIIEISHRSKQYEQVHNQAKADIKELMGLGDDYEVLFCQGGASMQFTMLPQNFAVDGKVGNYVLSGSFASKAYDESKLLGVGHVAASSKDVNFKHIPTQDEIKLSDNAAYLHLCYNNTIYGTEYQEFPNVEVPMIADMSSNMLSRTYDFTKFDLVWAGVQKNLGAAGTALVIVKESLLERARTDIPEFFRYETYVKSDSTYNTPPVFSIYTVNRTLHWLEKLGGLTAMEALNRKKAAEIYAVIDGSEGFYRGHAVKEDRSRMNVTFTLETPELESEFVEQAKAHGFIGLKGHRLVGGLRASLYNAVTLEAAEALAMFMKEFQNNH